MIEERLKSIMDEIAIDEGYTNWEEMYQKSFIFPERVVKAMKQAVNEALDEAAEKAELKNEFKSRPGHGSKYGGGSWKETSVDKESILNLKIL